MEQKQNIRRIFHLDRFLTTKMNVEWCHEIPETEKQKPNPWIDYDILRNRKNSRQFMMRLVVNAIRPDEPKNCGYLIKTETLGFFSFTEDAKEEEIRYLSHLNSLQILYGIVRGQIAGITGSFPLGSYTLPSIYMEDVIEEVQKRKAGRVKTKKKSGNKKRTPAKRVAKKRSKKSK